MNEPPFSALPPPLKKSIDIAVKRGLQAQPWKGPSAKLCPDQEVRVHPAGEATYIQALGVSAAAFFQKPKGPLPGEDRGKFPPAPSLDCLDSCQPAHFNEVTQGVGHHCISIL
jgi:hypothetical protein